MIFQWKMPTVNKMYLSLGENSFERFSTSRNKRDIVLAPNCKEGRPVLSEILVERGVSGDIGSVYR